MQKEPFNPYSIIKCSLIPTRYEKVLLTRLRDKTTGTVDFRVATEKIAALLVNKAIDCFPLTPITIETPLATVTGETLPENIELVSILRSGDALIHIFLNHFPHANVSKILVQRDEKTAEPHFIFMKLSHAIASGSPVIITEPMIATGGTLKMVIEKLKEHGVKESNIIIASICAAPEGLEILQRAFPEVQVVINALDDKLNPIKFIVPGLGDFGDRYFGT